MIDLYNAETNQLLGVIGESDLQVLIDALEEESSEDQDYFISPDTIELIASRGASPGLVELLRGAVGSSEGMEIRWQRRSGA